MRKNYTTGRYWVATPAQLADIKFELNRLLFMGWPEDEAFDRAVAAFLPA